MDLILSPGPRVIPIKRMLGSGIDGIASKGVLAIFPSCSIAMEMRLTGYPQTPPASQNVKMISPAVISLLVDEDRSRGPWALVAGPGAIAQPHVNCAKPSFAGHSGEDIHRTLAWLPGRLGMPSPSDDRGPRAKLPSLEEGLCKRPCKEFSSITVTARRVGPPEASRGTLCSHCTTSDMVLEDPQSTPGPGAQPAGPCPSPSGTAFSRNGSMLQLRVPEAQPWLYGGHECWVNGADGREGSFSPGSPSPGKGPLLFSSCVHLQIPTCPNSIYYLDKSLSIPIDGPPAPNPQVHRSSLSLHLSCSSHRPALEGDGGLATGEPMSSGLRPMATKDKPALRGHCWPPGLGESCSVEETQAPLASSACPWGSSPAFRNPGLSDVGASPDDFGRDGKDHLGPHSHAGGHPSQLTIHIPGWSYTAVDTKVFSGSSKRQQGEGRMTLSAPPVDQKPVKDFLPDGGGPPTGARQSRALSGYPETQHQSFQGPRDPLSGAPHPLEDGCALPEAGREAQIQREHPTGSSETGEQPLPSLPSSTLVEAYSQSGWWSRQLTFLETLSPMCNSLHRLSPSTNGKAVAGEGASTCCDLVVKIKDCKEGEHVTTPQSSPAPPEATPPPGSPAPEEPGPQGPLEDCPVPQRKPTSNLTLQEALEVRKPQFISRSQERVKQLELRVQQRKMQHGEAPGPKQSLRPTRANKKQFTVPHPLSDNLFKPRERRISEEEMYMRSKRIYNNLPEVKKKKEEQKKRVILQSNRLRAEVFKKQLLDQLLQRNAV
ncbi:(E2-independent) E3 ubiquitin-conjugating enzyme FATS [Tenrec ecaudatus]|uniref:(E2-independent) E3 ubiquitin-conjugating enzyme FATS n=1 Tax=Tenrec ecaudatus TaxID=94439 RepID=UPI003F59F2B3